MLSVIPGGCTRLCQPADVSWNAPFKAAFREFYSQWINEPAVALTPAGNRRAISKLELVRFVKDAWQRVSKDVISNSFRVCGITSYDPEVIHCTKEGNECDQLRATMKDWKPEHLDCLMLFDDEPDPDDDTPVNEDENEDLLDAEIDLNFDNLILEEPF